jgi:hypothetical protein
LKGNVRDRQEHGFSLWNGRYFTRLELTHPTSFIMATNSRPVVLIVLTALFLCPSAARPASAGRTALPVVALFDLSATSSAPFPSDRFTLRDVTQNTGLRVNLPRFGCVLDECVEIDLLNEMDGFHIWPRVSIPFSGPIDPASVNADTVFLLPLGSAATGDGDDADQSNGGVVLGKSVALNQLIGTSRLSLYTEPQMKISSSIPAMRSS